MFEELERALSEIEKEQMTENRATKEISPVLSYGNWRHEKKMAILQTLRELTRDGDDLKNLLLNSVQTAAPLNLPKDWRPQFGGELGARGRGGTADGDRYPLPSTRLTDVTARRVSGEDGGSNDRGIQAQEEEEEEEEEGEVVEAMKEEEEETARIQFLRKIATSFLRWIRNRHRG